MSGSLFERSASPCVIQELLVKRKEGYKLEVQTKRMESAFVGLSKLVEQSCDYLV